MDSTIIFLQNIDNVIYCSTIENKIGDLSVQWASVYVLMYHTHLGQKKKENDIDFFSVPNSNRTTLFNQLNRELLELPSSRLL